MMDHARQNFFAGSAFALNEHRHIGAGNFLDFLAHSAHRFRLAEDDVRGWSFGGFVGYKAVDDVVDCHGPTSPGDPGAAPDPIPRGQATSGAAAKQATLFYSRDFVVHSPSQTGDGKEFAVTRGTERRNGA